MEKILIEFISTLEQSVKEIQEELKVGSGVSGLTLSQVQYLEAIYAIGEPTITELANKLNITKASVTTGINKLVSIGYVAKTQSLEDKRVFHVSLTEVGEYMVKSKYMALKRYVEFISDSLCEEEAVELKRILTKLVKLFKRI